MRRHHYEQELKATYNREAHLASRLADADETLSILLELEPQLSKYRIERSEWQGGGCFWDLEGIRAAKKFRDDRANAEKYLPGSKFGDEKEIAQLLGETGVSDTQAREAVREFAEPDFDSGIQKRGYTMHCRINGWPSLRPSDLPLVLEPTEDGPVHVAVTFTSYEPKATAPADTLDEELQEMLMKPWKKAAPARSQTVSLAPADRQSLSHIAEVVDTLAEQARQGGRIATKAVTASPGLYRLGNGMVVEKRPGGWFSPNGSKQMDREVSFSATLTRLEVAK